MPVPCEKLPGTRLWRILLTSAMLKKSLVLKRFQVFTYILFGNFLQNAYKSWTLDNVNAEFLWGLWINFPKMKIYNRILSLNK